MDVLELDYLHEREGGGEKEGEGETEALYTERM